MRSIVVLREGADREAFVAWLMAMGLEWSDYPQLPRVFNVRDFPGHPDVESVEHADAEIRGAERQGLVIDGNIKGASWGLARIIRRAPPWALRPLGFPVETFFRCARNGEGVDIYVLDSGIRTSHVEFGGRATNIYEAVSSGGVGDDRGHGTATSSAAAGATVGPARAALIFSLKCLNSDNQGTLADLLACVNEALAHYTARSGTGRPAVVNLSLGFYSTTSALNAALGAMIDAGMVVVAAAGNDGSDLAAIDVFPAESDPDIIVAGATGPADIPLYSPPTVTNWGARVDVSAPGYVLRAASNVSDNSYYDHAFGTSFAAPHVAGALACMLQGHPRLSGRSQVAAVKAHLLSTATTGRITNPAGWGITLPDRLLYLNPDAPAPEPIAGL